MPALTFFTAKLNYQAVTADASEDLDSDPQLAGFFAAVTITPYITDGDGLDVTELQAATLSPDVSMLILAPVRARIDDGVLMLRVAEQAERERAQQSGQWEYAQLYADINALAPEVVRTCQQLGLKKSKLKQRFQMPTRPWYFYIHPSNDPAQRMGLAFFPDGRWEFVGNCTAKQINTLWVVPKEGQVSWSSDRGSLSKGNLHADLIRGLGEKRCAGSWGRHIPPTAPLLLASVEVPSLARDSRTDIYDTYG